MIFCRECGDHSEGQQVLSSVRSQTHLERRPLRIHEAVCWGVLASAGLRRFALELLEKLLEVYDRCRPMSERRLVNEWKNAMGGYSPEMLRYLDTLNQVALGSDRLTTVLAEIFSRFREGPTDWIYLEKKCCFIVGTGTKETEACILRREDLKPHVVLLPYDFFERYDRNPHATTMLVLHEVAHGYLGHQVMIPFLVERQQELDAWKLAAKWYRSNGLPRKKTK